MKYKIIMLLALFILPYCLFPHLLITEVFPNPENTEPYSEWVEIYNPDDTTVCIDGWSLDDGDGMWYVPDPNANIDDYSIVPGGFVVFANDADTFYSIYGFYPDFAKEGDSAIIIESTGYYAMNLSNTGDQVYLRNSNGDIVDAMQYGTNYEADSIYYPIKVPDEGESALRVPYYDEGTENDGELSEVLGEVWTYSDSVDVEWEGPNTGGLSNNPQILSLDRTPFYPSSSDSVLIRIRVVGGVPDSVILRYIVNSVDYSKKAIDDGNNIYEEYIPQYPESTEVYYYAVLFYSDNTDISDTSHYTVLDGGYIYVYFNKWADTSVSIGEEAYGNAPLDSILCSYMSGATYSVDVCAYEITRQCIIDTLIAIYNRGIKVRVITDNETDTTGIVQLKDAGIPVINDEFSDSYNGNNLMHNKFIVIDARDNDPTNDWVWTGSYNLTDNGTELNANNAVTIKSPELASIYLDEFNEMWGSSTDIPNSANSRFSTYKTDNVSHIVNVGGTEIEVYFSPSDHPDDTMAVRISKSNSAYFGIFYFTDSQINDSLYSIWNGFYDSSSNIRGIFDGLCWTGNTYSKAKNMAGYSDVYSGAIWSPSLDTFTVVIEDTTYPIFHHKYMILNANQSDGMVITGSTNWTRSGFGYNDENMLIIHSKRVSNLYYQELSARFIDNIGEGLELSMPIYTVKRDNISNDKIEVISYLDKMYANADIDGYIKIYTIDGRLHKTEDVKKGKLKTINFDKGGIYLYLFYSNGNLIKNGKIMIIK